MNSHLVQGVEKMAAGFLPKAVPLDKENPAAFFSRHLMEIAKQIKQRESLGSCRYELQFDSEIVEEWPKILEASIKKMGYSVTLTINQWNLAVFIIKWQILESTS